MSAWREVYVVNDVPKLLREIAEFDCDHPFIRHMTYFSDTIPLDFQVTCPERATVITSDRLTCPYMLVTDYLSSLGIEYNNIQPNYDHHLIESGLEIIGGQTPILVKSRDLPIQLIDDLIRNDIISILKY